MSNIQLDFKQQVSLDLTVRGRGGIVIYLAVWLITAVWSGIEQTNPIFFYLNTFLIAAIAVMRFVHYRLVMSRNLNAQSMYSCLVFLILIGALHWGILSAWVIFGSSHQSLYYPYMMILSALAIGGTAILSISSTVRILYPLFISLPSVAMGIIIGGPENLVLVTLLTFALLYVFETSRVTSKDYRNAFDSRKEADKRAIQMEQLSITDQLTGLHNRLYFSKSYPQEWKRCSRLKIPLSVLLIDLDHFKRINDSYGHIVGDECLIKVANVMKSEIKRDTDVVARYGGEEFIILLPDLDLRSATDFAKRLVQNIEQIELFLEGKPIYVSCSIGLASIVPDQIIDNQLLIKAADDAMYEAKSRGRNQYCVAEELRLSISLL
jgi:diguanylate cyclase (GGDEF)-like protein